MSRDRTDTTGILLAVLAVLSVSVAPVLVKTALGAMADPVTLLALRLLVATVAFWCIFPVLWPGVLRIDQRGLLTCAAVGAANAGSMLCYYVALTRINASVAHMVFSLYPVAALLMLALRGEPVTWLRLGSLGLGLLGVYLLIGPGGRVDLVGAGLVLASAVLYPLHMTLVQWYLGDYRSQTVALYVVTSMAAILILVRLLSFRPWQPLPAVGWGVVFITGLLSTVVARVALFAGIKRIGSGRSALLGPVETLLTVLWAVLFLGERLLPDSGSVGRSSCSVGSWHRGVDACKNHRFAVDFAQPGRFRVRKLQSMVPPSWG